jgi:hypothetical protein
MFSEIVLTREASPGGMYSASIKLPSNSSTQENPAFFQKLQNSEKQTSHRQTTGSSSTVQFKCAWRCAKEQENTAEPPATSNNRFTAPAPVNTGVNTPAATNAAEVE